MCDKKSRNSNQVGPILGYASREISRVLDASIAAYATPELSGARGMLLSKLVCAEEENKVVCQRDVEGWFHIRRSSVTAMLQGLEQDGFITRVSVKGDARLKRLIPTEKGKTYQKKIHGCIADFERELQQGITPQQLEQMHALLQHMLDNVHSIEEKLPKGGHSTIC